MPKVSSAVLKAREARIAKAGKADYELESFLKQVESRIDLTMKQRVRIATELVKTKTVKNISKPVGRVVAGGGRDAKGRFLKQSYRVTERSKPGEFPRAETTQLMKSIFTKVVDRGKKGADGYIGTPIDYGVFLELRLNRSFLKRTLMEEAPRIRRILGERIR